MFVQPETTMTSVGISTTLPYLHFTFFFIPNRLVVGNRLRETIIQLTHLCLQIGTSVRIPILVLPSTFLIFLHKVQCWRNATLPTVARINIGRRNSRPRPVPCTNFTMCLFSKDDLRIVINFPCVAIIIALSLIRNQLMTIGGRPVEYSFGSIRRLFP